MVRLLSISLLLGIGLSACGGRNAALPTGADGGSASGTAGTAGAAGTAGVAGSAITSGTGADGGLQVFREAPGEGDGPLSRLVIYFDFDRSEIRSDFNEVLGAHGDHLARNSGVRVRLEGHADERGSREYNIGLGEQRAQAVRRALLLQGASEDQLGTVSYGEERPAALGSDENSYGLNRRVELVYR